MSENIEIRTYETAELRADEVDGKTVLRGYAAKYNKDSRDLGGFTERISPGAFDESLNNNEEDVVALFNHDPNHVLGRRSAGTLKLTSDSTGLGVEIHPPETTMARDMVTGIKRRDIGKMSFAFRVKPGGAVWEDEKNASGKVKSLRTLKNVTLSDVSVVTSPAYPDTGVSVQQRSLEVGDAERKRGPALRLNPDGFEAAKKLIADGDISDGEWTFSAEDGNTLLGTDGKDWKQFGRAHLAIEPDATPDTKAYYGYPVSKMVSGKMVLFTHAVHAVRSRSAANGSAHIYEAAGTLEQLLSDKTAKADDEKKSAEYESWEKEIAIADALTGG
ncbi:MAG: HK97 family phage prohead protease [Phycisphaerae bacterium]